MDNTTLSILTIFTASLFSAGLAYTTAMWVNKRKVPVEVKKEKVNTELVGGELAEKYHSLANLQADENIELTQQNMELKKQIDEQNKEHRKEIEEIKVSMLELDKKHLAKEKELEDKINDEVAKREAEAKKREEAEDYIRRLILQLQSWRIQPVPFDVDKIKEEIRQSCIEGEV